MPTIRGAIRSVVLSPALAEVSFARRGFPVTPSAATDGLEIIPQAVICGFEWGIEARSQWDLQRRLAMLDPELAGFGYEGAAMACTVMDAMGRGHRTRDLLGGSGQPHIFLAYIGIGFAMARLPRVLWKKVIPHLDASEYHPTMSWLAVDGYGFDRAYFDTRQFVDEQHVPEPYPWLGAPDYFPRAVDQGIGRALWFIHGADVPAVTAAVQRFAEHRQADLWSGVGLAAVFAGGCGPDGLAALRAAAGDHWIELALGAVFAAKARSYAGFVPARTEAATAALLGLPVSAAVALADDTSPGNGCPPGTPAYEQWRRNIRNRLAARPANGAASLVSRPEADPPLAGRK
jgi:enediyne biosynthesis protein E2